MGVLILSGIWAYYGSVVLIVKYKHSLSLSLSTGTYKRLGRTLKATREACNMYYIGTGNVDASGNTGVTLKSDKGWKVIGYDGHYHHVNIKASEVLKRDDLLTFETYDEAAKWLLAEGMYFGDTIIEAKEDKDMSKKFYIKSGAGSILRYEDDVFGWELHGVDGLVYVDEVKPTDPRVVMFDTREEAQEIIDNHCNKYWNFEVVEFKEVEEVEGMKFYGIQFVTGLGNTELVSVVDDEYPMHTESDVAVVSVKPEELEHLVAMLPEHSHGKIVEVTMNAYGKWQINKSLKSEPVEQRYVYMLKGMSEATYIYVADNGVVSLTESPLEATLMTHEEALDLASKRGLKLTAFEEIEIEEVDE